MYKIKYAMLILIVIFFISCNSNVLSFASGGIEIIESEDEKNKGEYDLREKLSNEFTNITSLANIIPVGLTIIILRIFFKVELSLIDSSLIAIISVILLILLKTIFIFQINFIIEIFMAIILSISFIFIYKINYEYKKLKNEKTKKSKNVIDEIISYIKRKINKTHQSILSMQLYKVTQNEDDLNICYNVQFIDGVAKNKTEVNALLDTNLYCDKSFVNSFKSTLKQFNSIMENDESNGEKNIFNLVVDNQIATLKQFLTYKTDVDIESCCSARMILLYLAMLSVSNKNNPDTFLGVQCDSIFAKDEYNKAETQEEKEQRKKEEEFEYKLFTHKRTGLLGAILLQNHSYTFHYEDVGEKEGRKYYVLPLYDEKNSNVPYVVLIVLKHEKESKFFNKYIGDSLRSITNEIQQIYEGRDSKKNEENKSKKEEVFNF